MDEMNFEEKYSDLLSGMDIRIDEVIARLVKCEDIPFSTYLLGRIKEYVHQQICDLDRIYDSEYNTEIEEE